jgi:hypothetical protein
MPGILPGSIGTTVSTEPGPNCTLSRKLASYHICLMEVGFRAVNDHVLVQTVRLMTFALHSHTSQFQKR